MMYCTTAQYLIFASLLMFVLLFLFIFIAVRRMHIMQSLRNVKYRNGAPFAFNRLEVYISITELKDVVVIFFIIHMSRKVNKKRCLWKK